MSRLFVVNSSPLILLARIDRLDLLTGIAKSVMVPDGVIRELEAGADRDAAADLVRSASGLRLVGDLEVPDRVGLWDLGSGESQVLAHALSAPGTEAVIDDQAARRCAGALGVPTLGTLGLVITCRDRGLVPAARPLLEQLRNQGMYLKRAVLDAALAKVDE